MNHVLSINVDEIGKNIPEIVPFLQNNDINHLELRTINDKNIANFKLNDIQLIKEQITRYNYKISALASPLFKWHLSESDVIRAYDNFNFPCVLSKSEKQLAIDRVINIAQVLNCTKVRVFTGLRDDTFSIENLFADDFFRYCLYRGEEQGINILVENEPVCNIHKLNDLQTLLSNFKNLDLWLDVANFYQIGERCNLQDLEFLLPRIRHVHLKDIIVKDSQIQYVPLGEGDIPWREILFYFFEHVNHEISFSIETHVLVDKIRATERSISFYRSIEKLFT